MHAGARPQGTLLLVSLSKLQLNYAFLNDSAQNSLKWFMTMFLLPNDLLLGQPEIKAPLSNTNWSMSRIDNDYRILYPVQSQIIYVII